MKYRKKPVEVEAFRLGIDSIPDWFESIFTYGDGEMITALIYTLEGVMRAEYGDYIIRGVQGEIYPCKPDIFEATYEPSLWRSKV